MSTDFSKEEPNVTAAQSLRLSIKLKVELDTLKADQGEWYRLLTYPTFSAASRARLALDYQCPGFEFKATEKKVYGRYLNGDAS